MSDSNAKSLLTTGELAQKCGVTVRTVQYYDEKGLFEQQEKELVAKVKGDRSMLEAVRAELTQMRHEDVQASVETKTEPTPTPESQEATESNPDVEHAMSKIFADPETRLHGTQRKMLLEDIVVDIVEVGCIAGGIIQKNWWPLLDAAPLMIIITSEFVQIYHRDARYVCPHCHAVFQPGMREFFFSAHTPKTRKLSCVNCGTKDWCAEIPAEQGMDA